MYQKYGGTMYQKSMPESEVANRVWRYEYDQEVQEHQHLKDKVFRIKRILEYAKDNVTSAHYETTLYAIELALGV